MATTGKPATELKMDAAALHREDLYTDRKMGTIRVLTPVTPDGTTDSARPVQYLGEAQILTPMGAIPLSFPMPAPSPRRSRSLPTQQKWLSSAPRAKSKSCAARPRRRS